MPPLGRTRPDWYAAMTACVRSRASSVPTIRLTWVFTVSLLTYNSVAISAFDAASGDQPRDVDLAGCEVGDAVDAVARPDTHELVDQPTSDVGTQQCLSGGDNADGVEQCFRRDVLEQEAAGAADRAS